MTVGTTTTMTGTATEKAVMATTIMMTIKNSDYFKFDNNYLMADLEITLTTTKKATKAMRTTTTTTPTMTTTTMMTTTTTMASTVITLLASAEAVED